MNRVYLSITNLNQNIGVYIKFQEASKDNDKKGIYLTGINTFEMKAPIYTGEVSAIANTDSPTLSITEF